MATRDEKRRAEYHKMAEGLRRLEAALHGTGGQGVVPEAWHDIATGAGQGRKVKVTMWVEADVLRFFRSLGAGHTTRMAEVLATFMHARLAGVVKGPEDVDYSRRLPTPEEEAAKIKRATELEALMNKAFGKRPRGRRAT